MAKLILTLDDAILGEYPLDKARTSVGRRSTSDIHIDNLAVSGEHAVVLHVGNDFILEDVGSTNGTRVNGQSIIKHGLKHADVIAFGKYQLKYIDEVALDGASKAEEPVATEKIINTYVVDGGSKPEKMQASASAASVETSSQSAVNNTPNAAGVQEIAKVKLLNGSNAGRELTLNKAMTTLGKVGAQVAVITRRPVGYFIAHIEGKTFPIVNGNSTGAQAFALSDHDIIELAGVKMEFYLTKYPVAPA